MGSTEIIKALLALSGKTVTDLAKHFDITRQSMSNKMVRDTWTVKDLEKVAAFADCDLLFEMKSGQRLYLSSCEGRGSLGAKIPTKENAIQVDDDEYISPEGNLFTRGEIVLNDALGGGFERVKME
jgi:hypothetical protein